LDEREKIPTTHLAMRSIEANISYQNQFVASEAKAKLFSFLVIFYRIQNTAKAVEPSKHSQSHL